MHIAQGSKQHDTRISARCYEDLLVERVVMEVHHTGKCGGETHPVCDRSVPVKTNHLVLLCHVVQEAGKRYCLSLFFGLQVIL